jgi:hypothetical protein
MGPSSSSQLHTWRVVFLYGYAPIRSISQESVPLTGLNAVCRVPWRVQVACACTSVIGKGIDRTTMRVRP